MAAEPTGFRRWRRTRPFWGAVFAVLAGLELILIALAPLSFSIHQGMPGVATWLCGVFLVLCGVLACTQPQQRSFYGVVAVVAALGSFVTSNLGGFLLGLLLGLLGGGLIFAWTPKAETAPEQFIDLAEDLDEQERPALEVRQSFEVPQSFGNERTQIEAPKGDRTGRHRNSMKALAAGILPAAVGLHLGVAPSPQPTPPLVPGVLPAAVGSTPAAPQPSSSPTPQPSSSATPAPSPTQSGASASPKASSGPGSGCPAMPSSQGSSGISLDQARTLLKALTTAPAACLANLNTPAPKAARSDSGVQWYSQPATLAASAMWMYGMSYDGVVGLPTAHGSVQVLKFSMNKASLDNVQQRIGGTSSGLTAPNLVFDNGVVMYTTKLTGSLLGIPVTLEPGSPLLPVLQALNVLHLPVVELSNVVAEQPAVATASATVTQMGITA